jgi:hypothetical protein
MIVFTCGKRFKLRRTIYKCDLRAEHEGGCQQRMLEINIDDKGKMRVNNYG